MIASPSLRPLALSCSHTEPFEKVDADMATTIKLPTTEIGRFAFFHRSGEPCCAMGHAMHAVAIATGVKNNPHKHPLFGWWQWAYCESISDTDPRSISVHNDNLGTPEERLDSYCRAWEKCRDKLVEHGVVLEIVT